MIKKVRNKKNKTKGSKAKKQIGPGVVKLE